MDDLEYADGEQERLQVQLWEHFTSAAAGICKLYKDKIKRYNGSCFGEKICLLDTLSPVDLFFQVSRNLIGVTVDNGRLAGSRYLRLQLKDVAYATVQTSQLETPADVFVPLHVLVVNQLGPNIGSRKALNALGKRRICVRCRCCRSFRKKRTATRRSHILHSRRMKESDLSTDSTLLPHLNMYQLFDDICNPVKSTNVDVLTEHVEKCSTDEFLCRKQPSPRLRRRKYSEIDKANSISDPLVLNDCYRIHESSVLDSSQMFRDAIHISSLLDPLSKFRVTSVTEDSSYTPPKRPCPSGSVDNQAMTDLI